MNKWTLKFLVAAAAGVLSLAGQANAAVSYSYVADSSNYNVQPGAVQTVKLYLLETLTGSQSIINGDGGMLGVALKASKAAGGPANASTLGTVTLNGTDFAGGLTSKEESPTQIRMSETIGPPPSTGVQATSPAGAPANSIFVGSVSVTGGTDPGVTTFSLLPYDNLGGNTLTLNTFYDLDFNSANPAFTGTSSNPTSFTVTVVPEPTFAGAALVLGAAGALRRRRQMA